MCDGIFREYARHFRKLARESSRRVVIFPAPKKFSELVIIYIYMYTRTGPLAL